VFTHRVPFAYRIVVDLQVHPSSESEASSPTDFSCGNVLDRNKSFNEEKYIVTMPLNLDYVSVAKKCVFVPLCIDASVLIPHPQSEVPRRRIP
jgi:hypothetical protein